MRLTWTARALADMEAVHAYIDAENPHAAQRVTLKIRESALNLRTTPAIGVPHGNKGIRKLIVVGLPYLLPYHVAGDEITILRVLHTARKWPEEI